MCVKGRWLCFRRCHHYASARTATRNRASPCRVFHSQARNSVCTKVFSGIVLLFLTKKKNRRRQNRTQSTSNRKKLVGMCALIKCLRLYLVFLFIYFCFFAVYLLTLWLIYAHLVIKVTCGVPQGSVPGPKLFI